MDVACLLGIDDFRVRGRFSCTACMRKCSYPRLWLGLPVGQMRDPRVDRKVSKKGDARHKIKIVSV